MNKLQELRVRLRAFVECFNMVLSTTASFLGAPGAPGASVKHATSISPRSPGPPLSLLLLLLPLCMGTSKSVLWSRPQSRCVEYRKSYVSTSSRLYQRPRRLDFARACTPSSTARICHLNLFISTSDSVAEGDSGCNQPRESEIHKSAWGEISSERLASPSPGKPDRRHFTPRSSCFENRLNATTFPNNLASPCLSAGNLCTQCQ